jgi:hypothetical protein
MTSENQMIHVSSRNCHHRCLYCHTVLPCLIWEFHDFWTQWIIFGWPALWRSCNFRRSFLCPSSGFVVKASLCILLQNLGILRAQFGCEDVRFYLSSHKTPMPKTETVSKMSLTRFVFTCLIIQKEIIALSSSLSSVIRLHLEPVKHLVFCFRYKNKHKNQSNFSSGIQVMLVFPGGVLCSCDCNQLSHYLWACFSTNSQFHIFFHMQRAVTLSQ